MIPKNYFNEKLGIRISEKQLLKYFDAYNYLYEVTDKGYIVEGPSYRRDLLIKAVSMLMKFTKAIINTKREMKRKLNKVLFLVLMPVSPLKPLA